MFGNTKMVIEAQERHIVRLERMVQSLFEALMIATRSQQLPTLDLEKKDLVFPVAEMEPTPGDIFDANEIMRRP